MSQRTVLAETGVPSPPANYYVWSFPGSVTVHLGLDAVKSLEKHLAGMPHGLLMGKTAGAATEVTDFKILSTAELTAMRATGALPDMPKGLCAMGYFRVQRDRDLRLTAEDLALAKAVFPNPYEVLLVIQAGESGAANASFFFWDEGQMYGDFPFLEFPFDAALLTVRKTARQHRIEAAQEKRTAVPVVWEAPPHREAAVPVVQKTPPHREVLEAGSGGGKKKSGLLLGAVCLGALAGTVVAASYFPAFLPGISRKAAPPLMSLGLEIERQRGDLKLTWNHEAPVIVNATSGKLLVQDGATQRVFPLDKQLLHAGSLFYSPTSGQVQMSFTVQGPEQTATEMILVVISKEGPP